MSVVIHFKDTEGERRIEIEDYSATSVVLDVWSEEDNGWTTVQLTPDVARALAAALEKEAERVES